MAGVEYVIRVEKHLFVIVTKVTWAGNASMSVCMAWLCQMIRVNVIRVTVGQHVTRYVLALDNVTMAHVSAKQDIGVRN